MLAPLRSPGRRDAAIAVLAVAAGVALGVAMPEWSPHRFVHAPVGNAALDALMTKLIEEKTLATVAGDAGSIRIVDDYMTAGGAVLGSTEEPPEACARRCLATETCSGFSVTKAENTGAAAPLCRILTGAAQLVPGPCCTSGLVRPSTR